MLSEKVSGKRKHRVGSNILKYAAVACAVLGIAVSVFYISGNKTPETVETVAVAQVPSIAHGSSKAVLILEDGSFVKLDNITLGYNVPVKKLGFMQNLRLYLTGQNLFTITGYKGIDPEVDMVGLDNMGIERTRYYPASRSFILGLNVTF